MPSRSDLAIRVRTSLFIVPSLLIFIFIQTPLIIIPLYLLAVVLMATEIYRLSFPDDSEMHSSTTLIRFYGLLNRRIGFGFIILGALLTSVLVTKEVRFISDEGEVILGLMLIEFLVLSFISIFFTNEFETSFSHKKIHLFIFFYLNFIFLHIIKLKYFFEGGPLQELASFYLLLAFVICWVFDSVAYLFGRKWGRKKIGIKVSPQKSWVGLIAGLLSTFLAGALVSWILFQVHPDLWVKSFFAEVYLSWLVYPVLGMAAQWGDLIASLHKRSSGVKDTGNFLKGHGGFYDRNDSVILVSVVLYYFLRYYHS